MEYPQECSWCREFGGVHWAEFDVHVIRKFYHDSDKGITLPQYDEQIKVYCSKCRELMER